MNVAVERPAAPRADMPPVAALVELLERMRGILPRIPDEAYLAKPAPQLSGSIGEHVRHCLDHIAVLVSATRAPQISYDHRARGTMIENDRRSALSQIAGLIDALDVVRATPLHRRLYIRAQVHRDGAGIFAESSLGRELAFVTQHTIHHFAVMSLLLDRLGIAVPAGFGLAPSTPRPS